MRVIEAEAKQMLARRGVRTPAPSWLYGPDDPIVEPGAPVAVKAQLLSGNRANAGLIKLAPAAAAPAAIHDVRTALLEARQTPYVLVEAQVDIKAEYYLAWRIDDVSQSYVLMFSSEGGSNIEERGHTIAEFSHSALSDLQPHHLGDFLRTAGVPAEHIGAVARSAALLFERFCDEDATLLEINPLVVTGGGAAIVVDAKLTLDDNAAVRHREWSSLISQSLQDSEQTQLERLAAEAGFTFIELTGRVAVFSAGAGLGLCLLDVLADAGLPAANFADASGGSGTDIFGRMGELVFELAKKPEIEAILFFFVLSATSLKGVVEGLIRLTDRAKPPKPLIVGLMAAGAAERELSVAEARKIFADCGLQFVADLPEAIGALREICSLVSRDSQHNNKS